VAYSWFLFFSYHSDARSDTHQTALLVCPICTPSRIYCAGKSVRGFFPPSISRLFFCYSFLLSLLFPRAVCSCHSHKFFFCPSALGLSRHLSCRTPTSFFPTGRLRYLRQVEGRLLGLVLPLTSRLQNRKKRLLASSCPSVGQSARNNSFPANRIFVKFDIWLFFEKLSRKIKFK